MTQDTKKALTPINIALDSLMQTLTSIEEQESIELTAATGRILAEDFISAINVPPHDNSAMDGYALRSQDTVEHETTYLHVTQSICAGRTGQSLPPVETVGQPLE